MTPVVTFLKRTFNDAQGTPWLAECFGRFFVSIQTVVFRWHFTKTETCDSDSFFFERRDIRYSICLIFFLQNK